MSSVVGLEKTARACEGVDQLAAVVDEETRRHELLEKRVVRAHEIRERVAGRRCVGRRAEPGLDRAGRLEPCVDGDADVAEFSVDAPVLVERLVVAGEVARALARPEEEDAAAAESKMKQRERLLLRRRPEIDEKVSAADQVDAGERRVFDHVVRCEHDHLTKIGHDLVLVADALEVAREAFGRDVGYGLRVVDAAGGTFQRATMNVRREDLDRAVTEARHGLLQRDGERIGLFARSAACDPRAKGDVPPTASE